MKWNRIQGWGWGGNLCKSSLPKVMRSILNVHFNMHKFQLNKTTCCVGPGNALPLHICGRKNNCWQLTNQQIRQATSLLNLGQLNFLFVYVKTCGFIQIQIAIFIKYQESPVFPLSSSAKWFLTYRHSYPLDPKERSH